MKFKAVKNMLIPNRDFWVSIKYSIPNRENWKIMLSNILNFKIVENILISSCYFEDSQIILNFLKFKAVKSMFIPNREFWVTIKSDKFTKEFLLFSTPVLFRSA